MRRAEAVVRGAGALALVALLAGCGGSSGPTANPNARTPSTSAAPAPAASSFVPAPATTPPSSSPSSSPSASASAEQADVVATRYLGFRSPSGNIECGIVPEDDGYVRCDIVERDWEPPPPPADCELDYGFGLEVADGAAGFVCADDAVGAPELTLEYGERLQGGPIVCESAESGMTCTHEETGRGFTLARADYAIF